MRIALIRQRYTGSGGAERYVAQLATGLAAAGHEVHVFAHRWSDVSPGITVHHVPMARAPAFLRVISFAWAAHRMTRRGGYDVVHSFDRTLSPDVYRAGDGCHQAWLERRRLVENRRRGLDQLNPLHRSLLLLDRHLFRGGARRIVVNSRMVREEVLRYHDTPAAALHLIYTGVDLTRFQRASASPARAALRAGLGVGPDDPVVLFAGSGFERKGLRFLLEAVGRLRALPGIRLWVLGKGDTRPLRGQAARLGIAERVHFAGPVTDPEHWMAAADLFVLPTIYDPFSNACLEALACGLPVITTAANGAAEIVEEGPTGSVLDDPRDVEGLASRIVEFLRSERREERSRAARAAAGAFPAEAHVQQVLALYENLLSGART